MRIHYLWCFFPSPVILELFFFLVASSRAPGPVIISNLYLTECKYVLNTAFTPAASMTLPLLNQKTEQKLKTWCKCAGSITTIVAHMNTLAKLKKINKYTQRDICYVVSYGVFTKLLALSEIAVGKYVPLIINK